MTREQRNEQKKKWWKKRYHEDPEFREKHLAYQREYHRRNREKSKERQRRRRARLTQEQRDEINRRRRERYHNDPEFRARRIAYVVNHRKKNGRSKTSYKRKSRASATPRVRAVKPEPKRVPADVRAAWRNGHKNSIIRRKFPTPRALAQAAERGEFDQVSE